MRHLLLVAASSASGKTTSGGSATFFILIAVLIVLFLFMRRSGARRRNLAAARQSAALEIGREVRTRAGILARVRGFDGDEVLLEIAPGVVVRMTRAMVGEVVPLPASPEVAGAGSSFGEGVEDLPNFDTYDQTGEAHPGEGADAAGAEPESPADQTSEADAVEQPPESTPPASGS